MDIEWKVSFKKMMLWMIIWLVIGTIFGHIGLVEKDPHFNWIVFNNSAFVSVVPIFFVSLFGKMIT